MSARAPLPMALEKPGGGDPALTALRATFGFDSFRGQQEAAVRALLSRRDVLLIAPTGTGKTVCYALPAVVRGFTTVVVSPLIALMADQAAVLRGAGVGAASISGATCQAAREATLADIDAGRIRVLLVTAEMLVGAKGSGWVASQLAALARRGRIGAIAIDEAHCVSSWGNSFRPDYARLGGLRDTFPGVPVIAVTATATSATRGEIARSLALRNPVVLVSPPDRPNLSYEVRVARCLFPPVLLPLLSFLTINHPGFPSPPLQSLPSPQPTPALFFKPRCPLSLPRSATRTCLPMTAWTCWTRWCSCFAELAAVARRSCTVVRKRAWTSFRRRCGRRALLTRPTTAASPTGSGRR